MSYKYICKECGNNIETDTKCVSVRCGCGEYMSCRKKLENPVSIKLKRDN